MDVNDVTGAIVDSAIAVHTELGPGLLEGAYELCLAVELRSRGFDVRRQVPLHVVYRNVRVGLAYRLDLVVNELVVVEVKAVTQVLRLHEAQLLSYLKLSTYDVGLLINFHEVHVKDGIIRLINQLARVRAPRTPR